MTCQAVKIYPLSQIYLIAYPQKNKQGLSKPSRQMYQLKAGLYLASCTYMRWIYADSFSNKRPMPVLIIDQDMH